MYIYSRESRGITSSAYGGYRGPAAVDSVSVIQGGRGGSGPRLSTGRVPGVIVWASGRERVWLCGDVDSEASGLKQRRGKGSEGLVEEAGVVGFEVKEAAFGGQAAGIADEGAAGADDAVAGDDDGDGVGGVGASDGADGGGSVDGAGDVGVGAGVAEGDVEEGVPDAVLEGGGGWVEGEVEAFEVADEVGGELVASGEEDGVGLC